MATPSNSSTSSSEPAGPAAPDRALAGAVAWAAALVVLANVLVGVRLPVLLHDANTRNVDDLDASVARFDARDRVEVLVFGNSHAQHMLRPASLGPALGLAPDAVFSLALPGATAFEAGLLARRYLASFPAARRAIIGVDEVFLAMDPALYEGRIRYLTRRDPAARWRYGGSLAGPDRRVGLVAWMPWPAGDFAPELREAVRKDPRAALRRLVRGVPGGPPVTTYRWGHPPRGELPPGEALRKHRRLIGTYFWLNYRGRIFFGRPDAVPRALEDLAATCRLLEARGISVAFVAPLYTRALRAYLARSHAREERAFDAALTGFLDATGRTRVAPLIDPPEEAFLDADHLSAAGAARYAADVAPRLRWDPPKP